MKKLLLLFCFALLMGQAFSQVYELDNSYTIGTGFDGEVNAMSLDSNGKLVIGGNFTDYNGTTRKNLARLNADGTVDTGFDPGTSLSSTVYDIAVHSDNTITVATVGGVKRFDNTGAEITGPTFVPDAPDYIINVVAAESSGLGVIIAGSFSDVGGTTAKGIARLNADGTIDATFATKVGTGFNVTGSFGSNEITSIEITSGGKILLGGDFTSFNGTTRNYLALLNSDGTLDTAFDPGSWLNSYKVESVTMQADGRILAGSYSTADGAARINRFTAAGILDAYGNVFTNGIASLGISNIISLDNETAIFSTVGFSGLSMAYFGSSIQSVVAGKGVYTGDVNSMVMNTDGSLILGGSFSEYNHTGVSNFIKVATCAISIGTQPTDASACETTNTSFTVAASGTGTLTYQWQLNTTSLGTGLYTDIVDDATYGGATTATLAITAATAAMNNYYYRCIITDDNCSTTTEVKQLTVNANDQVITVNPQDATVCVGSNAIFSVTVTGTEGGYQWQEDAGTGSFVDLVNGGIYSGVTSKNVVITGATSNMNGYKYRLKSTLCDPSGVFSASAILTVNELPVVTEQPADAGICVSGDASYTVVATGSGLTYQWQYTPTGSSANMVDLADNANFSGVTTATLSIANADNTLAELYSSTGDIAAAYFQCVVTSNGCAVSSGGAYLRIYNTPTITTQPVSYSNCVAVGGTGGATMYPIVDINSGVSFQWEYDDGNGTGFVTISDNTVYSGTSTRVLNITAADASYSGDYRVLVGTCSPLIYSDAATFQLDERPEVTQVSEVITTLCVGESSSFEISSSNSNVTYQWQVRYSGGSYNDILDTDTNYSGATTAKLDFPSALNNLRTDFKCVVTNGSCETKSGQFTLYTYKVPTFNGTPNDRTACEGERITVSVGTPSNYQSGFHTRQWQEATAGSDVFVDITDATKYGGYQASSLTILAPTAAMNGTKYRQSVLGCTEIAYSLPLTLTVVGIPVITSSPVNETVCSNESVSFSATATGENLTYLWLYSSDGGVNYYLATFGSGYGSPIINIGSAPFSYNGYLFKCKVSSASPCSVARETETATLTVTEETSFTTSTGPQLVCVGDQADFTVTATGDALTYQWYENDVAIADGGVYSGATSVALSISEVSASLAGADYYCKVTGTCGEITSSTYSITVSSPEKPVIQANLGPENSQANLVASGNGAQYDWFRNGDAYQTTSNNQLNLTEQGIYSVNYLDINDCKSELSESIDIIITGFESNFTGNEVSVYPNPVNNKLTLKMGSDYRPENGAKIMLTNVNGKEVFSKTYNSLYNGKAEIDMTSYKSGIYLISIINGDNMVQYKITKQ